MVTVVCKDTGEVCETYSQYRNSKHWRLFKEQYKASKYYKGCCSRCKTRRPSLQIHHRHYDTLGREQLWDVEVLCAKCHNILHNKELPVKRIKTSKSLNDDWFLSRDAVDDYLEQLSMAA